jgi:tripartite-type tricarboxylate transporter receptor subunit TctC
LSKVNHKVDLLLFVPTLNANTETTKTVKKLIVEILKSEEVRRRIAVTGQTVSSSNEDQIKNTIQSNLDAWKKAGIY